MEMPSKNFEMLTKIVGTSCFHGCNQPSIKNVWLGMFSIMPSVGS